MHSSQSSSGNACSSYEPGIAGITSEFRSNTADAVRDKGIRRMLFAAVLIALILRLINVALVYNRFLDPSRNHREFAWEIGQVAYSIVMGHGFANPYSVGTGPTALLGPVFPYLLSGIFVVFGVFTKASAVAFLAVNSLFSALTCLPVFFLARKSFGLPTAKLAVWSWAFFPYAVYFSTESMWYNSFVTLFLALIFLAALYLESSDRVWAWAGFGFLFGVSALTNPVVLGILPFLGGWVCYRLARLGRRWGRAAMAGALALIITIAPWLVRNYRTFHRPVFLKDNFWMEVCVGNLTTAPDWWNEDIHPSYIPAEMAEFQRLGELGYMAEKRQQALAFIESHPALYLQRSVRRAVYVWTGFWTFHRAYLRNLSEYLANICLLTPLTLLSFWGLYRAFRKARETAAPYFLVLLTFPGIYYLTHPDPRYRHPLDPLLLILACSAIASRLPSRRGSAISES